MHAGDKITDEVLANLVLDHPARSLKLLEYLLQPSKIMPYVEAECGELVIDGSSRDMHRAAEVFVASDNEPFDYQQPVMLCVDTEGTTFVEDHQ